MRRNNLQLDRAKHSVQNLPNAAVHAHFARDGQNSVCNIRVGALRPAASPVEPRNSRYAFVTANKKLGLSGSNDNRSS